MAIKFGVLCTSVEKNLQLCVFSYMKGGKHVQNAKSLPYSMFGPQTEFEYTKAINAVPRSFYSLYSAS